jgi:hypothetical protein
MIVCRRNTLCIASEGAGYARFECLMKNSEAERSVQSNCFAIPVFTNLLVAKRFISWRISGNHNKKYHRYLRRYDQLPPATTPSQRSALAVPEFALGRTGELLMALLCRHTTAAGGEQLTEFLARVFAADP